MNFDEAVPDFVTANYGEYTTKLGRPFSKRRFAILATIDYLRKNPGARASDIIQNAYRVIHLNPSTASWLTTPVENNKTNVTNVFWTRTNVDASGVKSRAYRYFLKPEIDNLIPDVSDWVAKFQSMLKLHDSLNYYKRMLSVIKKHNVENGKVYDGSVLNLVHCYDVASRRFVPNVKSNTFVVLHTYLQIIDTTSNTSNELINYNLNDVSKEYAKILNSNLALTNLYFQEGLRILNMTDQIIYTISPEAVFNR